MKKMFAVEENTCIYLGDKFGTESYLSHAASRNCSFFNNRNKKVTIDDRNKMVSQNIINTIRMM